VRGREGAVRDGPGVTFSPEVTIIEPHPIPPTAGIGWVEHEELDESHDIMKQWTDYQKSMAPIDSTPDEAEEYVSHPEEYVPEPAYADGQEEEIAHLVSAHNESWLNNDPATPDRTDDVRTGRIRVT
jgi:hypothetical protein